MDLAHGSRMAHLIEVIHTSVVLVTLYSFDDCLPGLFWTRNPIELDKPFTMVVVFVSLVIPWIATGDATSGEVDDVSHRHHFFDILFLKNFLASCCLRKPH